MRRRLALYFDRKSCPSADDLADETLNRVARRLEEEGGIRDVVPARYCYITAKFVFLEHLRKAEHGQASLDNAPGSSRLVSSLAAASTGDDEPEAKEKVFDCLELCLQKLPPNDRQLILEYYKGEQRAKIERRSELAVRLGFTMNALTIRACRIRDKLEACVRMCSREG